MFHQRFASRPVSGHDVDDSGGQSGFLTKLSESERRQGSEFRGLQDHGVSGSQSRSNLPCRHEQWKIPRDNLSHDATRLILGKLLLEKLRPARMVVEVSRHERNVDVTALADWLAVVHRLQDSEKTGMFLHQPRECIQVTGPDVRSKRAPLRKRCARGSHSGVDVRG